MKKNYLFLGGTILTAMGIALFFIPAKANSPKITEQETISPFPEEVALVISNSCIGCHGEGGKQMAMSAVNFSSWNDYKPAKQASKAENSCKEVSSESMPPKSFRKTNPDLIPTEAQIKSICDWSTLLNNK